MKIIDLFSGVGGLTFGFYYKIKNGKFVRNKKNEFIFANEIDKMASLAFEKNFPDIKLLNCDIKNITKEDIKKLVKKQTVDIIIGGPPCQSYSTAGQRKYDERAVLYKEYFRILKIVKPKMFLFENVKGILSMRTIYYKKNKRGKIIYRYSKISGKESLKPRKKPVVDHYGDFLINKIKHMFENIDYNNGYNISYKVLNAVNYGVPENRERVFIVGIRKDLNVEWEFPNPLKGKCLSIKEAISDLPIIYEGEQKEQYCMVAKNSFQKLMRRGNKRLTQHFYGKHGEKMQVVIKNVKQGEGKNDFNELIKKGKIEKKYKLTSGYANTYSRLVEDEPAMTITNNLMSPSGLRCIHYSQNRALTPREGARIQSFPDWFQFFGSKSDVVKQIGNAVPPLLALQLAKQFEKKIRG